MSDEKMGCALHCWHATGKMLATDPPKPELECCHCGRIGPILPKLGEKKDG